MRKDDYINDVLLYVSDRTQHGFIENELSGHIDDRMQFYLDSGYDFDKAEERAVDHMGDSRELGIKMNELHNYKKHNVACTVLLVIYGIVAFVYAFYPVQLFSSDFIPALCNVLVPTYLLFSSVIYILCCSSRNSNQLTALGVIDVVVGVCSFAGILITGDNQYVDLLVETLGIVYSAFNENYDIYAYAFGVLSRICILLIGVFSLGYGAFIRAVIRGEDKN